MESPRDPRTFQGVVGNPRKSKELSEHPRRPWERLGGSRKLLEIRGGSRKSQGIRSHEWRSQVVPGDPRGRGPCESRGDMKEFQGISGKPLGSPREPRKSQGILGILGNPKNSGTPRRPWERLGVFSKLMEIQGEIPGLEDPGKVEGISGNPRGYQGNPWDAQESLGNPKVSWGILGNPMNSGNPRRLWERLGVSSKLMEIQ